MTGALEREGAARSAAWIPAYAGRARGEEEATAANKRSTI